jgi:hypothetical protein
MKQLISLRSFLREHHLPFGIVINQGEKLEWLTEEIIQIPVGWI